jgi:hypothetical protein
VLVTDRKKLKHRIRVARYRNRLARRVIVAPVELDESRYGLLVALGHLRSGSTSRREAGKAVEKLIDSIE